MTDNKKDPPAAEIFLCARCGAALVDEWGRLLNTPTAQRLCWPCGVQDQDLSARELRAPVSAAVAAPAAAPSPTLVDFHCPCCKRFLGRINKAEPGLTWCQDCKIEIATTPRAHVPTI